MSVYKYPYCLDRTGENDILMEIFDDYGMMASIDRCREVAVASHHLVEETNHSFLLIQSHGLIDEALKQIQGVDSSNVPWNIPLYQPNAKIPYLFCVWEEKPVVSQEQYITQLDEKDRDLWFIHWEEDTWLNLLVAVPPEDATISATIGKKTLARIVFYQGVFYHYLPGMQENPDIEPFALIAEVKAYEEAW